MQAPPVTCDFCLKEIVEEDEWCWLENPPHCTTCRKTMCQSCSGASCGVCSDPSGYKKYYCKDHQEPVCTKCGDLICEYCGTKPTFCYKCNAGPFHDWCRGYVGGDLCLHTHVCVD